MSVRISLMLLTLVTIGLPLVIGYFSLRNNATANAQDMSMPPAAAQTQIVTPTEDTVSIESVSVLGTIEANEVASLTFQTIGKVTEVLVEEGDYVEEGDILVRLDDTSAQLAYEQALLNLERAQLSLEQIYEPPTEDEIAVAEASITSAQGAYSSAANATSDEDLQQAQWSYDQALEAYNSAVTQRGLINTSVGDNEVHQYDAAIGAASFNLEIARLELESLKNPDQTDLWAAGAKITLARLELEQLMAGPTQEEIDNAELSVQNAEIQVAEAEAELARMQLAASISGYVTAVNIEVGQAVSDEVEVLEISDLTQLWLTAPIDETDVAKVATGMPATIRLDALSDVEFPATVGEISWLGVEEDDIVTYDTRLAVEGNDSRVRLGMTAEAFIELES